MIVLNSIFPVFILIVVGVILKRIKFTNEAFLAISDKLIYYILFPAMLFWKIGGQSIAEEADLSITYATVSAIILMFLLSSFFIIFFKVKNFDAGSFSQSCYRFNTYIGIAVVINTFGEEGLVPFGLIIAFVIPVVNLFSVSLLIWYSGEEISILKRLKLTINSIIKNPLIVACVMGLLFSISGFTFPTYLNNSFSLISSSALPLALISIGGSITFTKLKDHLSLAIFSSLFKLFVLPILGYLTLTFFHVEELSFKVAMIFFALPTSTAIYALSSQLKSNKELASSLIVLSTALSFVSLSAVLLLI